MLPNDVSRCVTKTCAKRDICARFMDCQPGQAYSFCDLTPTAPPFYCPFFIDYKPQA